MSWEDVDLKRREMRLHQQVTSSRLGPLKDDEARTVPILDALLPVLKRHRLRTGGQGLLFQPDRPGRRAGKDGTPSRFMRPNTLHAALAAGLTAAKLPTLTWYQATRHTFASQWVIGGGSLERLALILGHSSTEVTRRYAHLLPDHLGAQDRRRLRVRLASGQHMGSGFRARTPGRPASAFAGASPCPGAWKTANASGRPSGAAGTPRTWAR